MSNNPDKVIFENVIPLGWSCSTAASMAKNGYRAASGPFDWYLSDLEPVIKLIENQFAGFLNIDNLVVNPNDPHRFTDSVTGFEFPHEIQTDLHRDYQSIVDKYNRRIERFYEQIKSPTIFLRAVRSEEEKTYIQENRVYIENVIRRYNPDNMIVYLLPVKMGKVAAPVKQFTLNIEAYLFDPGLIRDTFDDSSDLLCFLGENVRQDLVMSNRSYDSGMNETAASSIYNMILCDDPAVAEGIRKFFALEGTDGILLWGAGHHGRAMCDYLEKHKVTVRCVIDSNRGGSECSGHNVVAPEEITEIKNVFIAIADRRAVDDVRKQIKDIDKEVLCCDYNNLIRTVRDL